MALSPLHAASVPLHETQNRLFDLTQLLPRAKPTGRWKSRWQCTTSDCPPAWRSRAHAPANTTPRRCSHLSRPSRTFAKSLPSGSSPTSVRLQWIVRCATTGRLIDFANLTASMTLLAWRMVMYLLARSCFLGCVVASDKRNSAADPTVPLGMINPPELTN